jgi:hypothetical protein
VSALDRESLAFTVSRETKCKRNLDHQA